ncbi:MAG: hypothetical protein AVDCRST_MAG87-3909 [uncultured Thermomicrobiales bacterium]|uniref:Uncharacterized protein n=1 Tax=uncultured Thermomicrobiales bacterium TaxID=1645740 RepID=A0A6J4VQE5_9BACT|nr:MAG: hypothetical protein AVDCRST_MAG87-3909 [uncultured Thermomicrobiales bacterium]
MARAIPGHVSIVCDAAARTIFESSSTGDSEGINGPHSLNCFAIACWGMRPIASLLNEKA